MIKMSHATESDIDFISQVCLDASYIYNSIMPGAFEKQAKKYRENGLPTQYDIWILYRNDCKIGFCAGKALNQTTFYIVGLYIHSKYQRRGFGKSALDQIQKSSEKENLYLLVHQKAEWAIRFYERYGFEIAGSTKAEVLAVEALMAEYYISDTFLMTKKI